MKEKRGEATINNNGDLREVPVPGMVVHPCNPSTWKAEAGGL
jgi:hypothetical protein